MGKEWMRLALTGEAKELKLGRSFTPRESCNAFHTIRYDFKPASVDSSKPALLDVGANNQVTVTAPNAEGSVTAETVFKGSRKPHQKECVLIINHDTGEITLERLSQNIIVKKTRDGSAAKSTGKAQAQLPTQRPQTPVESKKQVPVAKNKPNVSVTAKTSSQKLPKKSHATNNNPTNANHNKLSPTTNPRINGNSKRSSPVQPISPSMPILSSLPTAQNVAGNSTGSSASNKNDVEMLELSEASSDSSDDESNSSSNSSSSSESSSSDEEKPAKKLGASPQRNQHKSPSSSSSESESEGRMRPKQSRNNPTKPNGVTTANGTFGMIGSASQLPSMPKFSQLSEDLRLSESGSDSDD